MSSSDSQLTNSIADRGGTAVETPSLQQSGLAAGLPFPLVGIGASAGGLEAFGGLLSALPADTGMAFVVIQHLAPHHPSMLADILSRSTAMPVMEVHDEPEILPNCVYVIPPARQMVITDGHLKLLPQDEPGGSRRSVDSFFRSLAETQRDRAIAVLLSGTGNDGTLGLEAVKAEGGITFAQDESAQQTGMPRSAIASGAVDFILPPDRIAQELAEISRHPYVVPRSVSAETLSESGTNKVLQMLHQATGVDFSHYKSTTLHRRITRRMLLHRFKTVQEYEAYLKENSSELQILYQDILISVTSFFRDPSAFEALQRDVFPTLFQERPLAEPLRVWVLGCSSGEEAYSIAIALADYAAEHNSRTTIQIFATDLNEQGIERARAGLYSKRIAQDVSPERLRQHFTETEAGYVISKSIRDMCVYARQNVLSDPPFSRIDLITCRNLLIYMEQSLQRRILPLFHYALKPGGFLWLGTSESIGALSDEFTVVDQKSKIFANKSGTIAMTSTFPVIAPAWTPGAKERSQRSLRSPLTNADISREADRVALAKYAPASVLLDSKFEIIQYRGNTGPFLVAAAGKPTAEVLKLAREGLLVSLRQALQKAGQEGIVVREEGLQVRSNGGFRDVHLEVVPISEGTGTDRHFLVFFEDADGSSSSVAQKSARGPGEGPVIRSPDESERLIIRLTQELAATRDYMQSLIEQKDAGNEELQAANEEIQSSNEELQSVNEELQTSKEEIQSSNEELATVNDELRQRNAELDRNMNDLANFVDDLKRSEQNLRVSEERYRLLVEGAEGLAIIGLDDEGTVTGWNVGAQRVFGYRESEIVGQSASRFFIPQDQAAGRLEQELANAAAGRPTDDDNWLVRKDGGRFWANGALTAFRDEQGRLQGFSKIVRDASERRRQEAALRASEQRFRALSDRAAVGIEQVAQDGRVLAANQYLCELLGYTVDELSALNVRDFVHPDDQAVVLELARQLFAGEIENGTLVKRLLRKDGNVVWVLSSSVLVPGESEGPRCRISVIQDITARKVAEQALTEADRRKDQFLAMLAHELRNPLAPLRTTLEILRRGVDPETLNQCREVMDRQIGKIICLVDDLLDASRITQGKIELRKRIVDLCAVVRETIESTASTFEEQRHKLAIEMPDTPILVEGDPVRLEQVVSNLLGNACRYSDCGRPVSLALRVEQGAATIRVKDAGIGIAPDMLPRIFDLFMQVDGSTARARGGLGIGLSLVKQLVDLHGGRVEANSAGLGRGSEFMVTLPLTQPKKSATKENAPPAKRSVVSPRRVLVIDDNADAATSLAKLLSIAGHEVRVAYAGPSGLDLARQFQPAVVLLDIGLPGMDGYAVAREMRQRPETQQATLVAVSGYGHDDDRRRSQAAGFDAHLLKPVSFDAVNEVMARVPLTIDGHG